MFPPAVRLGLTMEKDAGEQFSFVNGGNGFDYYSFHFQLQNRGILKNLVLGDHQIQFGQGLVFGAGFSPGKGAETITTIKRGNSGLRPYTSVLESGFFRGLAATMRLGPSLEATAFYSSLGQDGNRISDTTYSDFDEFVNSIRTSGLHRTPSEIRSRNQVKEHSFGGNLHFRIDRKLSAGVNMLASLYNLPLQRRPNNYNQFEFHGDRNVVGSLYASYLFQNISLFAETAVSKSGGQAGVMGMIASLSPKIDMSLLYRNYARNFHSFYGNAFGEGSRNINEKGIFWGLKITPNRRHQISLSYDRFEFPWLRFRAESPSEGFEYLARYTLSPSRHRTLYLQYRQENMERTIQPDGANLNQLSTGIKRNILVNADYHVGTRLTMKTRVQYSQFQIVRETTKGLALVQDVTLKLGSFKIGVRYALFDTEDFENRQYVYERDVLYAFSIPAYHGQGTRRYVLVQHNVTRKITIWARYSTSDFKDRHEVGSGLEKTQGSRRSDLRVQVRLRL